MPKSAASLSAVDAYIAKSAPFAQPILEHLRGIMHEAAPNVEEAIKWQHPFFIHRGIILANMAAFKEHCSFGLWGKEVTSTLRADGVASGGSMGSFGRITSLTELPPRKKLVAYVKAAASLIDEGKRTKAWERLKVAKPPAVVPESLATALKKNPKAARQFEAMSPSCRREYCEWIADAKRDETGHKRVASALEMIAEGKSRNWKYEKRA